MNSFSIEINKDLNSREAVSLSQALSSIKSEIYLYIEDRKVNAKSILGLLSLNIKAGDILNFDVIEDNKLSEARTIVEKILTE